MTHIFRHIKKDLLTWVSKHQKVVWCMVHLVLVKLYSLVLVPHRQMVRSFSGRTPPNNLHRIYNELFSNISQVSWVGIGSNVYWWWCKIGQRCIRVRIEFFLNRKYRFLENFGFPKIFIVPGKNFLQQKKSNQQSFSLMKSMPLVQSVLILKKLVTEKSKELCSNFCHNLMVSRRVKSRNGF